MALNELNEKENVTEAPSNCNTSGAVWDTGKQLFEYIRKQTLADGTTGRVAFDEMGDRIYAEYQVVNLRKLDARGRSSPPLWRTGCSSAQYTTMKVNDRLIGKCIRTNVSVFRDITWAL